MTGDTKPTGQGSTFSFLRPGSAEFAVFSPKIHEEWASGRINADEAEGLAYDGFCGDVDRANGRGHVGPEKARDFHHDVLIRFEDRKLAERFDPSRGTSPGAYITGVASVMIKERKRRKLTPGAMGAQ